ncbi:MAG: amidohydrolase family protein [Chitinivibrionales bacterium]|nr:amidohydrolase family protein [Chitinivibrionales bacterium]
MSEYRGKTIDTHVHLQTVAAIDGFRRIMESCAIDALGVACIQRDHPHVNPVAFLMKARYPQSTFVFGGLDYDPPGGEETGTDFAGQVQRLVTLGADGMKMIEGKPNVRKASGLALDDPQYHAYYAYLQDNAVPVLFHVADPEEFWDEEAAPEIAKRNNWLYTDGTFPSKEQLYDESERVLRAFPALKVVFAHFRFLSADLERAAAFLDAWPNACFDLTPGSEMYYNFSRRAADWREFFVRYQDRILFGTDNTTHTDDLEKWGVENIDRIRRFLASDAAFSGPGLALPPEVLEKIYHGNFERVFGVEPKPVDVAGIVAQSAILLEHARATGGPQDSITELETIMQQLSGLV